MKLVRESLNEERIDEKWFNGDGTILTAVTNFLMATVGTATTSFLFKYTGDVAWGVMAPILFGVGGFGLLAGAVELDYFEWINDLEDWVKSRKYSTQKSHHKIDNKIKEIKNSVLNNPNIKRGQKAYITETHNKLKQLIEDKDWVRVRHLLNRFKDKIKDYGINVDFDENNIEESLNKSIQLTEEEINKIVNILIQINKEYEENEGKELPKRYFSEMMDDMIDDLIESELNVDYEVMDKDKLKIKNLTIKKIYQK